MTCEVLTTERLTLRRMQNSDALALHTFFSDPKAMEFWSPPHKDVSETRAWVEGTVSAPADQTCEFTILLGHEIIGKAGIWKAPELGYFLIRSHWGNGYMHEALTALIPLLHNSMGVSPMTAEVTPENEASMRSLAKVGFREVKRAHKDHWDGTKWCDTAFWERRANDPFPQIEA